MAYKLFDQQGNNVTHHNLQDKGVWCVAGATKEEAFVQLYGQQLDLIIHPEKKSNPFGPDLWNTQTELPGDLKTQNTPFFQGKTRFGISPQFAVVFNGKDRERYRRLYPDIEIYFAVDWQVVRFEGFQGSIAVQPMVGVWQIPFKVLDQILDTAPFHSYAQRVDDRMGNAKGSYVLDLQDVRFRRVV